MVEMIGIEPTSPRNLERIAGLEPASSRWQRDVLATGRYPHQLSGAGDGNRTRIPSLEGSCAAITPHPLSSRALHLRARGRHTHWRPWQESNPQTFRFGGGVSTIASRPTTTGVIDEARTRYQQIHNLPAHLFAFDHHTSGGPNRIRTGDFLRDKQARTARLLYESGKKTHW